MTSSTERIAAPPELAPFYALCQRGDASLSRVAARFARRQSAGEPPLDASQIAFALRAEGSPYVWPRAWTLEGSDITGPDSVARMRHWLSSFGDGGERRCGVALVRADERSVLAAVAVDALGDLAPLPTRVQSGAWLTISADMLVPTSDAKLLVLGPNGAPHAVVSDFDGNRLHARLRADQSGAFLVQVLANVHGGPRPVLEALVFANTEPPTSFAGEAAPGEEAARSTRDPALAITEMVNAARASQGSQRLARSAELDAIAQQHAEAMQRSQRVAHDTGDGNPQERVAAAGLRVRSSGENVAHALDVVRAHRALWASPSHRENLLQPRFDSVGIGIAVDPDGAIWVCEVFADL